MGFLINPGILYVTGFIEKVNSFNLEELIF